MGSKCCCLGNTARIQDLNCPESQGPTENSVHEPAGDVVLVQDLSSKASIPCDVGISARTEFPATITSELAGTEFPATITSELDHGNTLSTKDSLSTFSFQPHELTCHGDPESSHFIDGVVFSSAEENFFNLQRLLMNKGASCLRRVWKGTWKLVYGHEWDDSSTPQAQYENLSCGEYFYSKMSLNSQDTIRGGEMKSKIKGGDTREWDITLLGAALSILIKEDKSRPKGTAKICRAQKDSIENLVKFMRQKRNEINHMGEPEICQNKFVTLWLETRNLLVNHGENPMDCDAILSAPIERTIAARKRYLHSIMRDNGSFFDESSMIKGHVEVNCISLDVSLYPSQIPPARYSTAKALPSALGFEQDLDQPEILVSAEEIILKCKESEHFLLIGPAGSGKTCTLKRIACSLATACEQSNDSVLPLYVTVSSLAQIHKSNTHLSALQIVSKIIADQVYDEDKTFVLDMLEKRKLVLLADGFDLVLEIETDEISNIIFQLSNSFCKIILTSRYKNVHNLKELFVQNSFQIAFIQQLTEHGQEILIRKRFLQHNHRYAAWTVSKNFITSILKPDIKSSKLSEVHRDVEHFLKQSSLFSDVIKNPALLSRIIQDYLESPDITGKKAKVMKNCVRFLIDREKRRIQVIESSIESMPDYNLGKCVEIIQSPDFYAFLRASGYHLWESRKLCSDNSSFESVSCSLEGTYTKFCPRECLHVMIRIDCGILEATIGPEFFNYEPRSYKHAAGRFLDFLACDYLVSSLNEGKVDLLDAQMTRMDPRNQNESWRCQAFIIMAAELDDVIFEKVCVKIARRALKEKFAEELLRNIIFERYSNAEKTAESVKYFIQQQVQVPVNSDQYEVNERQHYCTDQITSVSLTVSTNKPKVVSHICGTLDPDAIDSQLERYQQDLNKKEDELRMTQKELQQARYDIEKLERRQNAEVSRLKTQLKDSEQIALQYETEAKNANQKLQEISKRKRKTSRDNSYFECEGCQKVFQVDDYHGNAATAKHARDQHQRTCYESDQDENGSYDCWTCGKCFSTSRGMFNHKKLNH